MLGARQQTPVSTPARQHTALCISSHFFLGLCPLSSLECVSVRQQQLSSKCWELHYRTQNIREGKGGSGRGRRRKEEEEDKAEGEGGRKKFTLANNKMQTETTLKFPFQLNQNDNHQERK